MKLSDATSARKIKPAVKTTELDITFLETGSKITGIVVRLNAIAPRTFMVKGGDIKKTFMEVEKYCDKLR